MQALNARTAALVGILVTAAAAALTPRVAAADCVPATVTIQSPAPAPPSSAALVSGTVAVSATATSATVPAAGIRVLDGGGAQVGSEQPGAVGAPSGEAYPVTATLNTRTLADGSYKLVVVAPNGCGTDGSAQVDLTVDNTAPVLSFTVGPAEGASLADAAAAVFTFGAAPDLTGVRFTCGYDAAALTPCTSPAPGAALSPGGHAFRVVGTDGAGNSSAISRAFTITAPAPAVTPTSAGDVPAAKARCRVPKLRGLTLSAARAKLRKANCRLGRVSRPPRSVLSLPVNRGQRLVVQRQSLRAGTRRVSSYPVSIALVPRRDLKLG